MEKLKKKLPIVTLAVISYNQHSYVRDAIAGAFSQTYEPLEIILSDDGSSDGTFEIMQEMAKGYAGPHKLVVRQNEINLQTALHIQRIANLMTGELLVVAAGDDISQPERCAKLVETWLTHDRSPIVLHSYALRIHEGYDASSTIVKSRSPDNVLVDMNWFLTKQQNPILSPTAAYSRCVFERFPSLIGGSIIEDGPLVVRGFLLGSFACVPEPLVLQRKHSQSSGTGYTFTDLARWNRFVRSKMISNFNKLQDIPFGSVTVKQARLLEKRTRKDIRRLSNCVFKAKTAESLLGRLWILITLIINYPGTYGLKGQIGFALSFVKLKQKRNW